MVNQTQKHTLFRAALLLLAVTVRSSDDEPGSSGDDSGKQQLNKTRILDDMMMTGAKSIELIQEELGITRDELNAMRVVRFRTATGGSASGLYATFKSGKKTYTGILSNQHVIKNERYAMHSSVAFMNKDGFEVIVPCNVDPGNKWKVDGERPWLEQGGFYFTGKDHDVDDSAAAKAKALKSHKNACYRRMMGDDADLRDTREIDQIWKDVPEEDGLTSSERKAKTGKSKLASNQERFEAWWTVQEKLLSHGRDWAFVGLDMTAMVSLYNGEAISQHTARLALQVLGISPYSLDILERESHIPGMRFEGINDHSPVKPGDKMIVNHYATEDYRKRRPYNKYARDPSTLTHPKRPHEIERAEREAEAQMAAAKRQGGIKVNDLEELKKFVEEGTDICFKGQSGDIVKDFEGSDTTFGFKATSGEEDKVAEPITLDNIGDGLVTLDVAPEPTDVGDKKGSGSSVASGSSDDPKEPEDKFHKSPRKVDEQTACVSSQKRAEGENTFIITGYELTDAQKDDYQSSTCRYFATNKFASTSAQPFEYDIYDARSTRIVADTNLAPGASGAPYFRDGQFVAIHCNGQWNNCMVTGFGGALQHNGDLKVSGAVTAVWVRNALCIEIEAAENVKTGGVTNVDDRFGGPGVGMAFNVKAADTDYDHLERIALQKYKQEQRDAAKERAKQRWIREQAALDPLDPDFNAPKEGEEPWWSTLEEKRFSEGFDDIAAKRVITQRTQLGGDTVYGDDAKAKAMSAFDQRMVAPSAVLAEPVKAEDPAVTKARDDKRAATALALDRRANVGNIVMPTAEPITPVAPVKRADSDLDRLSPRSQLRALRLKQLEKQKADNGDDFGGQMGRAASGLTAFKPEPRQARDGVWMHGLHGPIQDKVRGVADPNAFDGQGVSTGGVVGGERVDQTVVGTSIAPAAHDPTQHAATHLLSDANTRAQVDKYYMTLDSRHLDAYYDSRFAHLEKDKRQTAARARQADAPDTPAQEPVDQRAKAPDVKTLSAADLRQKRLDAMAKRNGTTPF